jgi:hypothetical protein
MNSNPRGVIMLEILLLIGEYWDIAYREGRDGRTSDTKEGDAQRVWSELSTLISSLATDVSNDPAVQKLLDAADYAENAMSYTAATVAPGNSRERRGDWVEVHAGRAGSSHTQLNAAIERINEAAAAFKKP